MSGQKWAILRYTCSSSWTLFAIWPRQVVLQIGKICSTNGRSFLYYRSVFPLGTTQLAMPLLTNKLIKMLTVKPPQKNKWKLMYLRNILYFFSVTSKKKTEKAQDEPLQKKLWSKSNFKKLWNKCFFPYLKINLFVCNETISKPGNTKCASFWADLAALPFWFTHCTPIAFDERVTFWLQRAQSLPCACAFAALYACAIA